MKRGENGANRENYADRPNEDGTFPPVSPALVPLSTPVDLPYLSKLELIPPRNAHHWYDSHLPLGMGPII